MLIPKPMDLPIQKLTPKPKDSSWPRGWLIRILTPKLTGLLTRMLILKLKGLSWPRDWLTRMLIPKPKD